MDFEWIAIGLDEVSLIALAFACGAIARAVGLPPLVGFLAAGFVLGALGVTGNPLLSKLADLGITLLLFVVGLKLNLRTLARPQVWAVAGLHMATVVAVGGASLLVLATGGVWAFAELDATAALLLAFALSFSSTVFVVKVLEERGELASLHGRIAVGILLVQDLAAVVFLAASDGRIPSPWALLLIGLLPLAPLLRALLQRIGHGELQALYGFLLALGGAELFEFFGMKGDLGALVLGVIVASHPRAAELAKVMLSFKDLFLLGFFLSVGLAGTLTLESALTGAVLALLILPQAALYFVLLTAFRVRARTALLASSNLTNHSEFGLIVAAIGVANGWISADWLISITIAMALSFAAAALLSSWSEQLYSRHRGTLLRFQREPVIPEEQPHALGDAVAVVVGMGGVGAGAYDRLRQHLGERVVGIDIDPMMAARQAAESRRVILGDPSDADFWDRLQAAHTLELILLALPQQSTTQAVLERIRAAGFKGHVAATARFPDQEQALTEAGADSVFNTHTEAGAGFAAHVARSLGLTDGAAAAGR